MTPAPSLYRRLNSTSRISAGVPDAWRHHLGFLLDGFRADRAHPLPRPLAPRQAHRAMITLGRRPAGESRSRGRGSPA